jgi:hypothetical protein
MDSVDEIIFVLRAAEGRDVSAEIRTGAADLRARLERGMAESPPALQALEGFRHEPDRFRTSLREELAIYVAADPSVAAAAHTIVKSGFEIGSDRSSNVAGASGMGYAVGEPVVIDRGANPGQDLSGDTGTGGGV